MQERDPRSQAHLTSSDLSLQAAIGLLSYLAMGVCVGCWVSDRGQVFE